MEIKSVQFIGLRSPLDPPARFSWGEADARNVGLVKVVTSDGSVGWGETSVTFPLWSLEERRATVTMGLAPMVIGMACGTVEEIQEVTVTAEKNMARLRVLWSPVGISSAIGALEMALLDAWGRSQGEPVWKLLGGEHRAVDLYAVGFTGGPEQSAEQASGALEEGYAAVKIRAGFGEDADLNLLRIFRQTLGDSATVYVDVNMGWQLPAAMHMAEQMRDFGIGWLEEPLSRDDLEGLRSIRNLNVTPLAAGENCYSRSELVSLAKSGLVDVIMPDLARCGGFLTALEGSRTALEQGLQYSTHHYASDIGFSAMSALCSVAGPSAPILRDMSPWPLREELLSEPLTISGGRAWAYEGPGLAPEPSDSVIERTRVL